MNNNHIPCRICNNQAINMSWNGSICKYCNSISVTILPSLTELEEYYDNFNEVYHGGGRKKGSEKRQLQYAKAYLRIVKKFKTKGRLLDIGPSNNPFPNLATQAGFQVTVIDFVKPKNLSKEITFIKASLNEENDLIKKMYGQYDIVSAFAILEHCREPNLAIRILSQLCTNGGYIVITTPLIGAFPDKYALGRTRWFCPPQHLHLISKKGLIKLFKEENYEILEYENFELNPLRWIVRYGIYFVEGILGYTVKSISRSYWQLLQQTKLAYGQGIALCVFHNNKDS